MTAYTYLGPPDRVWPDLPAIPEPGDVCDWPVVPDPNCWEPVKPQKPAKPTLANNPLDAPLPDAASAASPQE